MPSYHVQSTTHITCERPQPIATTEQAVLGYCFGGFSATPRRPWPSEHSYQDPRDVFYPLECFPPPPACSLHAAGRRPTPLATLKRERAMEEEPTGSIYPSRLLCLYVRTCCLNRDRVPHKLIESKLNLLIGLHDLSFYLCLRIKLN